MKKLTKEHWKSFEHIVNGTVKKDGRQFEALSGLLLQLMFEDITFKDTNISHDGNKDFIGEAVDGHVYWAESKNQKERLSLIQIAPTLVMAEIHKPDTLIFFSYSAINSGAKRKLGLYSKLNKRKLYLYDDESLESLIFSFGDRVIKEFFPSYRETIISDEIVKPYVFYNYEKERLYHYASTNELDDDSLVDGIVEENTIKSLNIGDIFAINLFCINRDARHEIKCSLSFEENDDFYCFEVLDKNFTASSNKMDEVEVKPGSVIADRIFLRYIKFRENIKLPALHIRISGSNETNVINMHLPKSKKHKIKSAWTRKAVFEGSEYQGIIKDFSSNCLETVGGIGGLLIYGQSGVGKTRILEECIAEALRHRYNVINFAAWRNQNATSIIKELVYILYDLSDEIIAQSLDTEYINKEIENPSEKYRILRFLKSVSTTPAQANEKFYDLIFEKLFLCKYAIILDDLQYFNTDFLAFIKAMIMYGKDMKRKSDFVFLCSMNTDRVHSGEYLNFITDFHELSNSLVGEPFLCRSIDGFQDEKQAAGFLASILCIQPDALDMAAFLELFRKCSLKPKYIEEYGEYLTQIGCVARYGDSGVIADPIKLQAVTQRLPPKFSELYSQRFSGITKNNAAKTILSLISLFGVLPAELAHALNLPNEEVLMLTSNGLIKRVIGKSKSAYRFEHDLIETYFSENEEDFLLNGVRYVNANADAFYPLLVNDYPQQYIFCKLHNDGITSGEIQAVVSALPIVQEKLPESLELTYHAKILDASVKLFDAGGMELSLFLEIATSCCVHIREHVNVELSLEFFERCYQRVRGVELNCKEIMGKHFGFTMNYLECKNHLCVDVLGTVKEYKAYTKTFEELKLKGSSSIEDIAHRISSLNNRVFMCGKLLASPLAFSAEYRKSMEIATKFGFYDLQLLNLFDMGSGILYEDVEEAIKSWQKGIELYEAMNIRGYLFNYYKKKIQLALLRSIPSEAFHLANDALALLKSSDESKDHIYFRTFFLKFRLISVLMAGKKLMINEYLDDFIVSQTLLDKEDSYEVFFLKAKVAFVLGEKEQAYTSYKSAFENSKAQSLSNKDNSAHFNHHVIAEEAAIHIRKLGLDSDVFDTRFLKGYQIDGGPYLTDLLVMDIETFDKFLGSYRTKALISSNNRRVGYIM